MAARVVVLGSGSVAIAADVPREDGGLRSIDALLADPPDAAVIAAEGTEAFFRASLALERGVRRVVVRAGAVAAPTFEEVIVPDAPGAPMPLLELSSSERALRCEEVAFAIGLKPVLYLVAPERDVAAIRERHASAVIIAQEDRCASAQQSGVRTYGVGDGIAHLFIGERAEEARALWAGDSTRNVEALGELMGYPSCCVRAFAAMANRRVNAAFPYVTAARTRALGGGFDALLDVTTTRLVPFVPCSYACPRAVEWAARVALAAGIARRARLVLYFDESRAIAFEHAEVDGEAVIYRDPRWAAPDANEPLQRAFGAIFGARDRFVLERDRIVFDNGRSIPRAGGLGVVLPFQQSATLLGG